MMIIPALTISSAITASSYQPRLKDDVTPIVREISTVSSGEGADTRTQELENEELRTMREKLEHLAEERSALFARKLAGAHSAEIQARLELINSRLEGLAPRILPSAITELDAFTSELASIRSEFGEVEELLRG